ncbi:DNA mismatch repair endonuclease MutL [Haliangium ochraceum]|uniref:DNA mismatch repair protein MutL n=1 Tax=Haliangium ochraceum (strain DSM 14365 / JCM 11303 / SMP-2) TaxID=502025 RepID=D0LTM5_HALO1|nr:DNA mismatch repair endonuclease MutL [Haliangium ochraceum]ACY15719.1 DNA mismatch repair protein MutL [Haliangium ochraceum DSM 14365]
MDEHRQASADAESSENPPRPEIRVLPDTVVDQIAAGEVVERPASVVKELVENALDAHATHVNVEVEAGGKQLIRVLDNGIGMTESDVRLALTRHATSKLRALDDLYGLGTMGFRGEALPSIAAVSRMSITTRTRGQVAGTKLDIEGGRITQISEVGAPVGTHIEIRDLLFNVPARLKFLKGNATEASHVTDSVAKLAMVHPQVHVRLRHGGRVALEAPQHSSGLERARAILGSRLGRELHEVSGAENGVRVTAYLAAPDLAQSTSRSTYLFVGKRAVKDRGLLHAVSMGYGELVPKGRFPVAVLCLEVPGGEVDVNVHPQKLEVRFSDGPAVFAAVRHVLRRGVAEAPWLSEQQSGSPVRMRAKAHVSPPRESAGGGRASRLAERQAAGAARMLLPFGRDAAQPGASWQPPARDERGGGNPPGAAAPPSAQAPSRSPDSPADEPGAAVRDGGAATSTRAREDAGDSGERGGGRGLSRTAFPLAPREWPETPPGHGSSRASEPAPWPYAGDAPPSPSSPDESASDDSLARQPLDAGRAAAGEGGAVPYASPAPAAGAEAAPAAHVPRDPSRFFTELSYIGQLDRTYLVCESNGEMVLVDQHAAHERVAFQRLRDRWAQHAVPVQRLLLPKTFDLSPEQAAVAEDARATLHDMGFELEHFGGTTYALKALPAGLRESDVETVLHELLDDLAERGGSRALEERLDLALATIACHSVVRAGDALSAQEVRALFKSLDEVDFKAHCPHGRPVLLRISVDEIARRFGR